MFMLQLARQTVLPNYLAIYENGCKKPAFSWACKDIEEELTRKGTQILYEHAEAPADRCTRYGIPLRSLVQKTNTDIFVKMDLDDFYFDQYIEHVTANLANFDWAVNLNNGLLLVRPHKGDFKYKSTAVMMHNPVKAAALAVFNRKFAVDYLGYLFNQNRGEDTADDDLMAECLLDKRTVWVDGPVDYVYVSHGANESSSSWQSTGGKIYFEE
jgi:hypothetical protein